MSTAVGVLALTALVAPGVSNPAVADEGPSCTLSGYHAVAGDFVPAGSAHASIAYGGTSRVISPTEPQYHEVGQSSSVTNRSTGHAFYDATWVIAHVITQRGNTATRYTTTYDGSGVFVGDVAPTAPFVPLANPTVTFRPLPNAVLPDLGTLVYGDIDGAALTGTLSGVPVSVAATAAVPAYAIGDIPVGATAPTRITARIDRPAAGSFGWQTSDLIAVRTCLPDPTIDSWVSGSGLTPITGTGDYAGDQIVVTDASGAVVGTAVVQPDLTWSLVPTSPLPPGITALTVTETDEFGLTGIGEGATAHVVTPSVELAKLTDGVDAADAPGPDAVVGATVRWTFEVRNTGDTALADVSMIDQGSDGVAPVVTCPSPSLAVDESMTCTASGIVALGAYRNDATVVAVPVDSTGAPIQETTAVTASDSSWYTGVTPPPATDPPVVDVPDGGTPTSVTPTQTGAAALAATGGEPVIGAVWAAMLLLLGAGFALTRRRHSS